MPFFSIILPTYNRAHFLSEAIESVRYQTYNDWELIIIDDGSTDNTSELVESYCKKDNRILYIYQENAERSAARNNGIDHAVGEYICFLDSDDYYLQDKLINLKEAIDKNGNPIKLFYDGLIFQRSDQLLSSDIPTKKKNEAIYEFLLENPLFSQQICGQKSIFTKQKYNPKLRIGEDVELWMRIALEFELKPVYSHQTVIVEHDDRSVNLKKYNSAKEQLKQLNLIYSQYANDQISLKVRRKMKSNCLFNISKYFMFHKSYFNAIYWVVKSILMDLHNDQLKHRIFTLYKLITGRIPREYQL